MVDELVKLYNTMMLIETKGENTKQMAMCLNYLSQLITTCASEPAKEEESVREVRSEE